ncbi:VOC family protein [Alkalihalobacillus sp. 1P02AB]|uniref:VOC family protein n=1 Tax=Alkalihalobacillus sp. 1P02AB TaxID=3132260 RepID=UPI0039A57C8C
MPYTLHPAIKLGEFQIKVSKLERSIEFYEKVIGFKLLKQEANKAYLTVDEKNPLLILHEIDDAKVLPPNRTAGLYHFALLLPSREELGLLVKNILSYKIPLGSGDHLVSEAFYLSDPDQNGIEVYVDRPKENWKKNEDGHYIMTTKPVDAQSMLDLVLHDQLQSLPSTTKLGHVHFHAHSVRESVQFYRKIIGFDVTLDMSRMGAVFMSAGGYHHHIAVNRWAGERAPLRPAAAVGLDYYTIVLPTKEEMNQFEQHLQSQNINYHVKQGELSLIDPNGIQIRVVTD